MSDFNNLENQGSQTFTLQDKHFLEIEEQITKKLNLEDDFERKNEYQPTDKYIYKFSMDWEFYLKTFDNSIINVIQKINVKKPTQSQFLNILAKIFKGLALIITFITTIENGPSFVIFLLTIGLDSIASWFFTIGLITTLIAQIPKRFMFRKRPHMVGRAYQLRGDKTSSFPSRAVICSVVYTYAITQAYNYYQIYNEGSSQLSPLLIVFLVFIAGVLASLARIHLGAHYPSDCVCGFVLGLLICLISLGAFQIPNIMGCPSMINSSSYPTGEDPEHMDYNEFSPQNQDDGILVLIIVTIIFIAVTIPPIKFWDKSAPILGSYTACYIATLLMICPKDGSKGLVYMSPNQLSFKDLTLAFILSETTYLLSVAANYFYRRMKKLSFIMHLLWNLAMFYIFTIANIKACV